MGKLLRLLHEYAYFQMRVSAVSQNFIRLSLLVAAGIAVWLYATGLWRPGAWKIPAAYSVDALEMLARLKFSGAKGLGFLFDKTLPGLGAPWVADWSAYPMPDAPEFILFGKIAAVIGLIESSNLALLFAHVSAVGVFYLCSRALGHRALFAAAGALLFGFSFYICHRGLSHYSFALAYIVPAQLLSAWLIGSGHLILTRPGVRYFCLATAVATGVGNPYFGFGYCQLLALALVYQAATTRRRNNLSLGLACFVLFAATLVLLNYSSLLAMLGGKASLLQRNYASTEIFGLRPIELLIPPPYHHWPAAAKLGAHYAAATSLKGELFSPYLGFAGCCGVLVLLAATGRQLLRGRVGLRPAYGLTFLWITVFFMVGGLNSLLALAGIDLFRAGNRYSIYLLAVALLALVSWASRHGRHLRSWTAFAFAAPVVLIGLWDQLPRTRPPADGAALGQKVSEDQRLARHLEAVLPPGAAVFQLPVMPFLEQPPVNGMSDYDLFRPWLFSDRTRYSYGLLADAKALHWQRWVAAQPPGPLCAVLENAGYAALYINKAAFPDAGAGLRQQLTVLGKKLLFDAGDHLVFALQPARQPQLPDLADVRVAEPWRRTLEPDGSLQLFAPEEWFALEHDDREFWRWTGSTGTVNLWCPGDQPLSGKMEFSAALMQPAQLSAAFGGHEIWSAPAGQLPETKVSLVLTFQPGANRITFHYAGRLVRPSATDARLLGFRLINLHVTSVARP